MSRRKPGISSKSFKRPDIFWFEETQSLIRVAKQTEAGFSHALKLHLSKKKIVHPLLDKSLFECAFCSRPNSTWFFKTTVKDKLLSISGIDYRKPVYFCFLPGTCRGKKLNANSIEFVSATRKVSEDRALEIIHSRNSSPFYRSNHEREEDYQKYQGTRITNNKSQDEIQQILAKQNYSKSLECYIERFGQMLGTARWKNIQSSKGITLDNLKRKHGENAQEVLQQWKSKIGPSLKNFRARYGEELGLQKYREFNQKVNSGKTNAYGKVTIEDGHVLRSNYERMFFNLLKQNGVNPANFLTDGYYPDSVQRYDFYFPSINMYVEIAGIATASYEEKLMNKQLKFKPIIVRPKEFQSNGIHDIIAFIKNLILLKEDTP